MVAVTRAKRRLASAGGDVRGKVAPALGEVRGKVAPALGDVRERLTPSVDMPRVHIKPALHATTRIVPVAQSVASGAVSEGKRRGRRAAVKLGLADEPRPSHRLRNLMVLLALGAVGYLAYRRLSGGGGGNEAWTPPPTAPATSTTASPPPAPSAPLVAEETVASPVPTTPDEPFTETEVH